MWGVKHNKVTDSFQISRSFPYPPPLPKKGCPLFLRVGFLREYIYIYTHIYW